MTITTTIPASEAFKVGDLVKIKSGNPTRSPYRTVCGFEDETTITTTPIDGPGNGNRKQRRAEWRKRFKRRGHRE